MRPCCIHFGGERNSKINENLPVRIQQAATNNIITSSNWSFVLKNQPTKKRGGGGDWRSYNSCTLYTHHIKDALDNHEQTGGGACCKRPRQRGADASFSCVLRSCRDVQRLRHMLKATTAAIFQSHAGWTSKRRISYFGGPRPESYTNIKAKKRGKKTFSFAFLRVCQLSTGPYHVWHIYI